MSGLEAFGLEPPHAAEGAAFPRQPQGDAARQGHRLDRKTESLLALAVAAVVRGEDCVCEQVAVARRTGASRNEVAASILAALPVTGTQPQLFRALATALTAYDAPYRGGGE